LICFAFLFACQDYRQIFFSKILIQSHFRNMEYSNLVLPIFGNDLALELLSDSNMILEKSKNPRLFISFRYEN